MFAGYTRFLCALLAAGALTLSACGGSGTANEANGASAGAGGPGGWNALDACATLGNDKASAAVGTKVTGSKLDSIVKGSDGAAEFSTCTYTLDKGASFSLLTRQSAAADSIDAAIASARTMGGNQSPAKDVPGLGKAALWSEGMKTLQVFLDHHRYASISFYNLTGSDGKAQAIAIAKALP
ncbi:hypothetical protein [Sphingobium nicotianae]|uniref:DUF3558 domain-containing protein n=1 Tax=Sphingobium nicotianae TaxID=2782607 RepID=A0A9X1DBK8_9SPHN|nr:hypothetical protein [Sphingobium nicotianae]MBT2186964.1 hypothetical protein [Sphingobium nicotianae]